MTTWLIVNTSVCAQATWSRTPSNTAELLNAVAHGNGLWAAVGENGALVTSLDASTWTLGNSGTSDTLRAIVHDGAHFVAAGRNGTLQTSPDGNTWSARNTGVTALLSGLAHGDGLHVAVGANGTVITSPDAVTWTTRSSGTSEFLQGIHHGAGLFVAVGPSGTIVTSPDGIIWSDANSNTSSFLVGGGYFAGRHYVVGQDGVIASSANGSNWLLETSGTLARLRAFTTDGTTALVCGDDGTLLKSTDGAAWAPVSSGQSVILAGAAFADNRFVVVGEPVANDGLIIVRERDPGLVWETPILSVGEADGSITLTIRRLGPTTSAAAVAFQTASGTATEGVDFTPSTGTKTIPAGESTVDLTINITENPEEEPPETFTVTLSSPDPADLVLYQPAVATVTIVDAQDSDFDGLPDDWERQYFDNVEAYGPDDDPDTDHNTNARELADDTDPSDPESASYQLALEVTSGQGTLSATPDLPTYPKNTLITVTPAGTGDFTFAAWQGDADGTADPLVFNITRDTSIGGSFEVSLADALDQPDLNWTTGGSGPPWVGQGLVTSDGADSAETGGLALGEQSTVEALVYGPANLNFQWRTSTGPFDAFQFYIDTSRRAQLSGEAGWQNGTYFIGSGTHRIRWTYAKNSSAPGGTNHAWLDQVALEYGYPLWQRAYFNTAEQANPLVSGPAADPDADGWCNQFEYLYNLNPKLPDSGSPNLPTGSIVASGGQEFAAYTWSQHAQRAAYLVVTVEFSTSLESGSWQPLDVPLEVLSSSGAMETVRVTSPIPVATLPQGFFRTKLSLLP